jgi:hypothetical protein
MHISARDYCNYTRVAQYRHTAIANYVQTSYYMQLTTTAYMLDLLFCYLLPIATGPISAYLRLTGKILQASTFLAVSVLSTLMYLTWPLLSASDFLVFRDQSLPFAIELFVAAAALLSGYRFGSVFFWIAWLGNLVWPAYMLFLYAYLSSRLQHW